MQKLSKHLSAALLSVCLLVVLAFGGVVAFAAIGDWWPGAEGGDSLTVNASGSEFAGDIAEADVVVDVYQIGTATPNENFRMFDYALTGAFADDPSCVLPANPTAADWEALANEAAKLVQLSANGVKPAGEKIAGLDDGLYLVLAHGKGVTDGFTAYSKRYEYTFAPTIVALPTLDADGNWDANANITMKPERQELYGSIKITKTLTRFIGGPDDPRSFVFHITGTLPDGTAYGHEGKGEWAEIHFESGTYNETVVDHIPVGTRLTVTEESTSGTGYRLVSGDSSEKVIVADRLVEAGTGEMATAAFVNEPDGSRDKGYGVENRFELSKTGEGESDWDWEWISVPDQPRDQQAQS